MVPANSLKIYCICRYRYLHSVKMWWKLKEFCKNPTCCIPVNYQWVYHSIILRHKRVDSYVYVFIIVLMFVEQVMVNREDLRSLTVCSVDPPGCTDIDDALHCRELDNGNLEVHILDTNIIKLKTCFFLKFI